MCRASQHPSVVQVLKDLKLLCIFAQSSPRDPCVIGQLGRPLVELAQIPSMACCLSHRFWVF